MFGSFIGNVAGISYFLAFQILGILLALYLFQKEKREQRFYSAAYSAVLPFTGCLPFTPFSFNFP